MDRSEMTEAHRFVLFTIAESGQYGTEIEAELADELAWLEGRGLIERRGDLAQPRLAGDSGRWWATEAGMELFDEAKASEADADEPD